MSEEIEKYYADEPYSEIHYVKRYSDSEVETIILFFESQMLANVSHYRAKKANDARILFGDDFPKEIANCWM